MHPRVLVLPSCLALLLACGDKRSIDESTDAVCALVVKVSKDTPRLASKLDIEEGCKASVERVREVATPDEFTTFAKCVYGTKNSVDAHAGRCDGRARRR
jgi:hypothetical protein